MAPRKPQQSTHPQGWPGIPGRSPKHERHQQPFGEEAQVTEAQRELEKKPSKPPPRREKPVQ